MRLALISDIHGNLEALEAVLDDVRNQGIDEVFCLGDIIGHGPNPRECIDRVMETCKVTLMGNRDQWDRSEPEGYSIKAEYAISWTREQLEDPGDRPNGRRRAFLAALPRTHRVGPDLFVHGSPRNPLSEYVFPEDIYNPRKMDRLFQLVDRYCFQGHTHVPGIFTDDFQFFAPDELGEEYKLGDGKRMINVGSVGQPRDGDPRACYLILDDGPGGDADHGALDRPAPARAAKVAFRRIPYDFDTTIRKIRGLLD